MGAVTAAASSFLYEPLSAERVIRVLDLLPASHQGAPVVCRLREISLDSTARGDRYEALSYVWGAPRGDQLITCNGRPLYVTPNCRDALLRLRRRRSARTLWVDAICINQEDSERSAHERAGQVEMMGEVYEKARGVIVWLGRGEPAADQVFLRLQVAGIARMIHFAIGKPIAKVMRAITQRALRSSAIAGPAGEPGRLQADLKHLLSNPWFSRVWTIQEVAFSRRCHVLWGESSMRWEVLESSLSHWAIAYVNRGVTRRALLDRETARSLVRLHGVDTDKWGRRHQDEELSLLASVMRHRATKPVDKVYSVYGILRALGWDLPQPDYDQPLIEAFEETTRAHIRTRKNLAILTLALRPEGHNDFPSWVPEWTRSDLPDSTDVETTGIKYFSYDPEIIYAATGDSVAYLPPVVKFGILPAKGSKLGTIRDREAKQWRSDEPLALEMYKKLVPVFRQWCQLADKMNASAALSDLLTFHSPKDVENDPDFDAVWTQWFDLMLFPERRGPRQEFAQWLRDNGADADPVDSIVGFLVSLWDLPRASELGRMVRLHYHVISCLPHYAVFALESDLMGIAFNACREGDAAFLLAGADCPMILRPHQGSYRFVAPAYIYGVMNGEMWDEKSCQIIDIV